LQLWAIAVMLVKTFPKNVSSVWFLGAYDTSSAGKNNKKDENPESEINHQTKWTYHNQEPVLPETYQKLTKLRTTRTCTTRNISEDYKA
jgi:hypothetical protein